MQKNTDEILAILRNKIHEMREASYTISQYPEIANVVFDSVIDAIDDVLDNSTGVTPI